MHWYEIIGTYLGGVGSGIFVGFAIAKWREL